MRSAARDFPHGFTLLPLYTEQTVQVPGKVEQCADRLEQLEQFEKRLARQEGRELSQHQRNKLPKYTKESRQQVISVKQNPAKEIKDVDN